MLPQENDNGQQPFAYRDEATKQKIKRHISDINDVISENDIKNAKLPGIDLPSGRIKKQKNGDELPQTG